MRIIDADALIDELQKDEAKFDKEAEDAQNDPSYTECYSDAMGSRANGIRDAIIEIYDAPTIEAVSEWIPCSERLPNNFYEDEMVLATTDVDGLRVILMLAVDVERFYLKGYVSAWMPSPEPWKGADDGDNNQML